MRTRATAHDDVRHRILARWSAGYDSDAFTSVEAAQAHIDDLLHAMMSDPREDWTGCRFEIMARSGERLLTVPVLTAMSALARKLSL